MKLGEPDASGRRSPVDTGETRCIPADTVIAAVGEQVDPALFEAAGCEMDAKGRPVDFPCFPQEPLMGPSISTLYQLYPQGYK